MVLPTRLLVLVHDFHVASLPGHESGEKENEETFPLSDPVLFAQLLATTGRNVVIRDVQNIFDVSMHTGPGSGKRLVHF